VRVTCAVSEWQEYESWALGEGKCGMRAYVCLNAPPSPSSALYAKKKNLGSEYGLVVIRYIGDYCCLNAYVTALW